MSPHRPSSLRASLPAIAGVAACAACCTLPFLVPLLVSAGLGSALLAWASTRSELLGLSFLVLGVGGAGIQWWRSGRAATAGGATCATDGSCGCGPALQSKSG